ncbi:nitrous oxide-stimulated promoter family protein [Paenibacillus apis]|uniref:nitrous oxide-stimulated promoter family protein n=1 Tax=Paenibacillus apis TaxID=1792174 RepID=UPI0026594201|nr:nitrous oxide-stimulated promoter family protein [Paenibacillus apis]
MNMTEQRASGRSSGRNERIDGPRIRREKTTVRHMISMYCKIKHPSAGMDNELCPECRKLADYALNRLTYCRFGEDKSSCRNCEVHCYAPDYQQRIREVMRFAGMRMLWRHPWLTLRHMADERQGRK